MAGSRKERPWFHRIRSRRPFHARRNRHRPQIEQLEAYVLLSNTYTVTMVVDDGHGDIAHTLSWAIDQVNADTTDSAATPDEIAFDIPGKPSAAIISPSAALPSITNPVIIDGTTQPVSGPVVRDPIEINGDSTDSNGLVLAAGSGGSSVLGLSITNFADDGILLESGSNTVADDDIGVDYTGYDEGVVTNFGNGRDGVAIESSGNTIGGATATALNVISDNFIIGVSISGSGTSGNVVEGDYIGTTASGDTALGNLGGGVYIDGGAYANTVADCTIASNEGGVNISGSGTTGNVVEGDYIGTDSAGDSGLGNTDVGVTIYSGATDNTIGGTTPGSGNVIASNFGGIDIENSGTSGNVVEGNYIGTDANGDTGLSNTIDGVQILGGASSNTIGGTTPGASNTIADNGSDGVGLNGPATSGNLVAGNTISDNSGAGVALSASGSGGPTGNKIGGSSGYGNSITSNFGAGIYIYGSGTMGNIVAGDTISANTDDGVDIFSGASGNTIGGTSSSDADTIMLNQQNGIVISAADDNVVERDYIGTNSSDENGLGNFNVGVMIDSGASGNTIGGARPIALDGIRADVATVSYGNTIVSNGTGGVDIENFGTSGNVVEGNYIGTDADGDTGLGNSGDGVQILEGATGNTIGGPGPGAGNTIDDNTFEGVGITGPGTTGNVVSGNTIDDNSGPGVGLSASGSGGPSGNTIGGGSGVGGNSISGNQGGGIYVFGSGTSGNLVAGNTIFDNIGNGVDISASSRGGPTGNTIGGTSGAGGNDISSNQGAGIYISGSGTTGNLAIGDMISGNTGDGVDIFSGAGKNTIGGTAHGDADTIISNSSGGVDISGTGTSHNVVEGDYIGTDAAGDTGLGNNAVGVTIFSGATDNTINEGDTIDSNGAGGIDIENSMTSGNVVEGDYIGTNSAGDTGLGNSGDGVQILGGASGNTIGGGNTIADNTGDGVGIVGSGTSGNVVEGNYIGTNSAGATNLGNSGDGVEVFNAASGNTVGGTVAGAGNVIDDNLTGVVIGSSATDTADDDAILGNSIYANTSLGIDLGNNGVTPNDSSGHTGPNLFQDFPVITAAYTVGSTTTIAGSVSGPANSTLRVELFSNPAADPSGYGQGQVFLGYVMVTTGVGGGGSFTFTPSNAVPVGDVVSATATDVNGNTSEFAADVTVSATAPLDIGYQIVGPVSNPIKHTYTETVTLTNDGTTATGAFDFVLEGLTSGVTLTNGSGTYDGSPYVAVGSLGVGQSVTVTLTFTKTSSSLFINYTPEFVPAT